MTTVCFRFIDQTGQDITAPGDVPPVFFKSYFARSLDRVSRRTAPQRVQALLQAAYLGPDEDGIGVAWTVTA